MSTVEQIVNGAAEHIGVKTAEVALEAGDFQVFLDNLNDLLEEWADIGLTPAFREVSARTDNVKIDSNARAAVKSALAMRCAPAFQRTVSSELNMLAKDSLKRLRNSTFYIERAKPSPTLPIGSGNLDRSTVRDEPFFTAQPEDNF